MQQTYKYPACHEERERENNLRLLVLTNNRGRSGRCCCKETKEKAISFMSHDQFYNEIIAHNLEDRLNKPIKLRS